jgi:hypothetical protein
MTYNSVATRPFFTLPSFFPSPEKPFLLPSYAEAVAGTLASQQDFCRWRKSKSLDPTILQFIDETALESEQEISSTESSDDSHSMSSSST